MIGRVRTLLAALAVAVPSTIVGGAAAATPSAAGVLTGVTTITWSGAKGISLAMPQQAVSLPASRMKLFVGNDATYAFVRLLPTNSQRGCWEGAEVCDIWGLDYFREYDGRVLYPPDYGPADQHSTSQSYPPTFNAGGRLELYLFTDGTATVQLLPVGLTGTSDYVATGAIHGLVRRLSASCPTAACNGSSGYAGRFSFGGEAFDIGFRGGAEIWAVSLADRASLLTLQSTLMRVCIYPGLAGGSADPESHRLGCDLAGTNLEGGQEELFLTTEEVDSATPGYDGVAIHYFPPSLSGKQYVGYHLGSIGDNKQIRFAYGIWWSYGIPGAPV